MKSFKFISAALMLFCIFSCSSSNKSKMYKDYNFDFENIEKSRPAGWFKNSDSSTDYIYGVDSTKVHSGRYSIYLEQVEEESDGFATWLISIPKKFKGHTIKLTGYIKTENVNTGHAAFWLRLDPDAGFDNMYQREIKGTTDWTKCSITMRYPYEATEEIVAGCMLLGDGKAWFDDISITIDGKDIGSLETFTPEETPAAKDTAIFSSAPITSFTITDELTDRLEMLGHVWGIIKYFHPEVAKGNYNMDAELFRILPDVLNTENNLDSLMIEWIERFGKISSRGKKTDPMPWVEKHCSDNLKKVIYKMVGSSREFPSYYISKQPADNPGFDNEDAHFNMNFNDTRFTLLSLFRYWNMIEYYFPYKNLIEDWDGIMREYIPLFANISDENEYILSVQKLVAEIEDTHAMVFGKSYAYVNIIGRRSAGYTTKFIGDTLVVSGFTDIPEDVTPALEKGDIIVSINGEPVDSIVKRKFPYISASNYPTKLREIASQILRSNDEYINIEYLRDGNKNNFKAPTFPNFPQYIPTKDTCFRKLENDIAYINCGSYLNKYRKDLWPHIKDTKGLIIDLRYYPKEFMLYDFGQLLVSEQTPFTLIKSMHSSLPGTFSDTIYQSYGKKNKEAYKGAIVILVNEETQSQAEFTAQAYSYAPNAVVMGSTTAGADGDMSFILLPGNLGTYISGIGIYLADGSETQKVGIVPDIFVTPTVSSIKEGRDMLLEKAVEYLNSSNNL